MSRVEDEFANVNFGDERLSKRLIKIGKVHSESPEESICSANACPHAAKAAYRFLSNPKVSPENILSTHVKQTHSRSVDNEESVLLIHDTTSLIYTQYESVEGMGRITSAKGMKKGVTGLLVHNTIASTESGLCLGLLKQSYYTYEDYKEARGQQERNVQGVHKTFPIEKKASIRWIQHISAGEALTRKGKQIIHVGDREADIYEFFTTAMRKGHDFVVRSKVDRRTLSFELGDGQNSTLEKELAKHSPVGSVFIERKAKEGRVERHEMELKYAKVTLKAPQRVTKSELFPCSEEICMTVISLRSASQPDFFWRLVTNLDCDSLDEALRVVEIYRKRWQIEVFHRALKSGFSIEKARLGNRSKIEKLCAILSVLSWRVIWLYLVSRIEPKTPVRNLFSNLEIRVLSISKYRKQKKGKPLSVVEAIYVLARLGGYLGRASDGPPGMSCIWKGLAALYERVEVLEETR